MSSIISPQGADGFGSDPAIQTISQNSIQILHRAEFNNSAWCLGDRTRRYFVVQENAIESNHPVACCWLPGNCLCPGTDFVQKYYFDRGPYDQQSCLFCVGYLNGAPSMFPGEVKLVCCCMDMPECCNNLFACLTTCYAPCCCGDRVRYLPADYYCWCCPTRSWCLTNYCGLCGIKTGDPLILGNVECCLKEGTAASFVVAAENGRATWRQRTGKN